MILTILVTASLYVGGVIAGAFLGAMVGGYLFGCFRFAGTASTIVGAFLGVWFAAVLNAEMEQNSTGSGASGYQMQDEDRWRRR